MGCEICYLSKRIVFYDKFEENEDLYWVYSYRNEDSQVPVIKTKFAPVDVLNLIKQYKEKQWKMLLLHSGFFENYLVGYFLSFNQNKTFGNRHKILDTPSWLQKAWDEEIEPNWKDT